MNRKCQYFTLNVEVEDNVDRNYFMILSKKCLCCCKLICMYVFNYSFDDEDVKSRLSVTLWIIRLFIYLYVYLQILCTVILGID